MTTKAEVEHELQRRGFTGSYRIKWIGARRDGDWLLLGTAGGGTVKEGAIKGTNYRPHSDDQMDFWTSRTQLVQSLEKEFPSLVIEHCSVGRGGEAWGYIDNSEFEAFAQRLGIRTRRVVSEEQRVLARARFVKITSRQSAKREGSGGKP